jgi:hypothetical protein
MRTWAKAIAVGLALAVCVPAALGCGYCAEDKVASVYDHAAVKKALGSSHHVAFFHIDGQLSPAEAVRRAIQSSAESVDGVDRGSVRISLDTASVAIAFDPGRVSLASLQNSLDRKLAPKKLSLFFFQIMDRPGELKSAKR